MQEAKKFDTLPDFTRNEKLPVTERPKTRYNLQEVEAARAEAYAAGLTSAEAKAAESAARSFDETARACVALLNGMTDLAHSHKEHSIEVAMATAKKLAAACIEKFGTEQVLHLVQEHIALIQDEPKIVIEVAPHLTEPLATSLETLTASHGVQSQIEVRPGENLTGANCRFTWSRGGLEHDAEQIAAQIEKRIADQLNVEKLAGQQADLFAGLDQ